ncbi:MAG: nucleotidyltransferase domain-containing protein [Defluviitaleaceae bacterium]|nr:nucleotidyltransferase domain-containing protein [Defluviitaleaceae bacterium]
MTTIDEIIRIISPIIHPSPVRRVILFGSYARGTSTTDSDIDLIIDSNGQLRGINFFALSSELAQALPIEADIFEMREINPNSNLYDSIKQEGVVIYDR